MRYSLMVLVLSGCAGIVPIDHGNPPPADWPQLRERVVYIQPEEFRGRCNASAEIAAKANSCAVINFHGKICMIYLGTRDPATLEHERWHCRGYGHVGSPNHFASAWEQWKKQHGR